MDIITHTLSGMAAGSVFAGISEQNNRKKAGIIALSGFAGAFPDIDAISLWSHFNGTIGHFFHLPLSGKDIYSAKLWYSHHGFFHSLIAAVLFSILVSYLIPWLWKRKDTNSQNLFSQQKWMFLSLFCAYTIHLLEDMPTPAASWGGVRFFWPFSIYIGGGGQIWWWNNYDIFLLVLAVLCINLTILFLPSLKKIQTKRWVSVTFVLGLALILTQIFTRNYDFSYEGNCKNYSEMESQSQQIQQETLGTPLHQLMLKTDRCLKVAF